MPFDGTEVKKDNDVTKALILARNRISYGWCQGRRLSCERGRYSYCAAGAIIIFRFENEEITQALSFLGKATRTRTIPAIERWNDSPGRTKGDVLAAFDRAIELSRQQ